jgi:hypothetical protein
MTPFEVEFWRKKSADLGIEIVAPFELILPEGLSFVASALVRDFGPRLGMIVDADYEVLRSHTGTLSNSGYGYSSNIGHSPDPYSRDAMIEILKDWGWNGPATKTPAWLD